MADYNKILLLSQLTGTDPANQEAANKLAAAIRQTRDFLKSYLAKSHNDDGTLKDGAVSGASTLASQSVPGTTANSGGTAGKIQQGTVSTPDLRDEAVGTNKLAALAVTTAKLADDSVTAAKIATDAVTATEIAVNAVTTTKIVDAAVTANKLAAEAVETAKIKDIAVTGAKIAGTTITEDKMASATAAKVLSGTGTGAKFMAVGGVLTASVVADVLTFAYAVAGTGGSSSIGYVVVREKRAKNSNAGGSTAATYVARTNFETPAAIVTITGGSKIKFDKKGTYVIRASAPAYGVGLHKVKVVLKGTPDTNLLFGNVMSAPAGVQNVSSVAGLLQIANDGDEIEIKHWCENTVAGNGLGQAANISDGGDEEEVYTVVEILRA